MTRQPGRLARAGSPARRWRMALLLLLRMRRPWTLLSPLRYFPGVLMEHVRHVDIDM